MDSHSAPSSARAGTRARRALQGAGWVGSALALWTVGTELIAATGFQPHRSSIGFGLMLVVTFLVGAVGGALYGALLPFQPAPSWARRAGAGAVAGAVAMTAMVLGTRLLEGGVAELRAISPVE